MQGLMLTADRYDRTRYPRSMPPFDPADYERLIVQDAIYEETGELPDVYANWRTDILDGVTQPRWLGSDVEFARYGWSMRQCLLLPLSDAFLSAIRAVWEGWGVPEAERRMALQVRRINSPRQTSDWQTADLLAEVEAVCGEGRKQGRQWAFRCPWHDDKHPSLMVDPVKKLWKCWPCDKGGGVIQWRKANGR